METQPPEMRSKTVKEGAPTTKNSPPSAKNSIHDDLLRNLKLGKNVGSDFAEVTAAVRARFAEQFANHPMIKVIAEESVGLPAAPFVNLQQSEKNLVARGLRAYVPIILGQGLFHRQFPSEDFSHDGDFFYLRKFASVSRLTPQQRLQYLQVIAALATEDYGKLVHRLVGDSRQAMDKQLLAEQLRHRLHMFFVIEPTKQRLSRLLGIVANVCDENGVSMPNEFRLLLGFIEGMEDWAQSVEIDLGFLPLFAEIAEEELQRDLFAMTSVKDYTALLSEWKSLLTKLPQRLEQHLQPSAKVDLSVLTHQLVGLEKTLWQTGVLLATAIGLVGLAVFIFL